MKQISAPVLFVGGPTASGKSGVAVELARRLDGEIVNVDSVQLYRGFDVGSAKIPLEERMGVPHHLFDVLEPGEQGNVARFIGEAYDAIAEIQRRGKLAILTGGSTLYVTALFHGIAPAPGSSPARRAELDALSDAELHRMLQALDSVRAAELHPHDRVRVVRAIEIAELQGAPSRTIEAHGYREQALRGVMVVLVPERAALHEAISVRTDGMLRAGLEHEVVGLIDRHGSALPALSTIGYREIVELRAGRLAREALAPAIAAATRQYAKRQMTYWRNEPAKRGWRSVPPQVGEPGDGSVLRGESHTSSRRGDPSRGFRVFERSAETLSKLLVERLAAFGDEPPEVWYVASPLT